MSKEAKTVICVAIKHTVKNITSGNRNLDR